MECRKDVGASLSRKFVTGVAVDSKPASRTREDNYHSDQPEYKSLQQEFHGFITRIVVGPSRQTGIRILWRGGNGNLVRIGVSALRFRNASKDSEMLASVDERLHDIQPWWESR